MQTTSTILRRVIPRSIRPFNSIHNNVCLYRLALQPISSTHTVILPRPLVTSSVHRFLSTQTNDSSNAQTRQNNNEGNEVAKPSSLQQSSGRDLVLSPPALVITREYEWANIIIGFEQANKYTIRAAPGGEVVGYLAEESSIGNTITRNMMRTRRPFKATVLDKEGNPIFTLRRPLFLVSTSIFVETPDGQVLGEVHMNWHVWRRRYDLYVDKTQFASVDSGFLAVDFDMRDINGKKLASVNKDFTGFAREIFTDARQYVLRLDPSFGLSSDGDLVRDAATVDLPSEEFSNDKLGHRERAVILATAIAIDFDYFSVHSRGPITPGMMMPIPVPGAGAGGANPDAAAGGAGGIAGADVLSDTMLNVDDEEGTETTAGVNESGSGSAQSSSFDVDVDADPYAADPSSSETNYDDANDDSEWATFEEPDYGFVEEPDDDMDDDGSWFDSDGDGGDSGDDGDDGGGGIMSIITSIFTDNDS